MILILDASLQLTCSPTFISAIKKKKFPILHDHMFLAYHIIFMKTLTAAIIVICPTPSISAVLCISSIFVQPLHLITSHISVVVLFTFLHHMFYSFTSPKVYFLYCFHSELLRISNTCNNLETGRKKMIQQIL